MKLKENMQCPICANGILKKEQKKHEVQYKDKKTIIDNLDVLVCTTCHDGFYTKKSERKINIVFADMKRKEENLLTSKEIKEIRKQNYLTQEELSVLLGMSLKTIARYENGTIIQGRSTDILLRLLRDYPATIKFLKNYSSLLDTSLLIENKL